MPLLSSLPAFLSFALFAFFAVHAFVALLIVLAGRVTEDYIRRGT
jgi:hypothetical protein